MNRETLARVTSIEEIDAALGDLQRAKQRWARMMVAERRQLLESCLEGVVREAGEWVAACCAHKGISPVSALAGEEIAAGPLAVIRYFRLVRQTLLDLDLERDSWLPLRTAPAVTGQVRVSVLPCDGLFDAT